MYVQIYMYIYIHVCMHACMHTSWQWNTIRSAPLPYSAVDTAKPTASRSIGTDTNFLKFSS